MKKLLAIGVAVIALGAVGCADPNQDCADHQGVQQVVRNHDTQQITSVVCKDGTYIDHGW
jgi:hypothetical protein